MRLAVRRRLAAVVIEARSRRAGAMSATTAANVYHAFLGMCLTVRRYLDALEMKVRSRRARPMSTTPV